MPNLHADMPLVKGCFQRIYPMAVVLHSPPSAKPLEGYKLQIKFENGEEKIFDLTPYLTIGKFAELRDIRLFNSVSVKFDSIEWANHLDIDPEFLYAHGVAVQPHLAKRSTRADKKQATG